MRDQQIRALERAAASGAPAAVKRLQRARDRIKPRDPRRDPMPGDRVRVRANFGISKNYITRLVVKETDPVLAYCTPWSRHPFKQRHYCVGVIPEVTLGSAEAPAIVDPGSGEEPGNPMMQDRPHWAMNARQDGTQYRPVVHWRRVEGKGPKSGCCFRASWRVWAKDGEVLDE